MEVSTKPSLEPDFSKLATKTPVLKLRSDLGKEQGRRHKTRGLPSKEGGKKGQGHTGGEGRKQKARVTELKRACEGDAVGGEGDSAALLAVDVGGEGDSVGGEGDSAALVAVDEATRVMEDLERVLRKDGVIRPCESLSPAEVLDRANQYIGVLVEMEKEDRNNHFG